MILTLEQDFIQDIYLSRDADMADWTEPPSLDAWVENWIEERTGER